MKFQFATASVFLVITIVAICLGAITVWAKIGAPDQPIGVTARMSAQTMAVMAPFWVPIAFFSYCLGRRRWVSWWIVAALAVAQTLAVTTTYIVMRT